MTSARVTVLHRCLALVDSLDALAERSPGPCTRVLVAIADLLDRAALRRARALMSKPGAVRD